LVYYRIGAQVLCTTTWQKIGFRLGVAVLTVCVVAGSLRFTPRHDYSSPQQRISYDFPEAHRLIREFAPVVYLAREEPYRPVSVSCFFDNAKLVEDGFAMFNREITSPRALQELLEKYSVETYYLEIDRALIDDVSETFDAVRQICIPTVYASAARVQADSGFLHVIQYWFFFWASTAGSTGLTWHECDWEMVQYELDDAFKPIRAGYSQHYNGDVRNWGEIELEDGRPVVYISWGGHSAHFHAGIHTAYVDNARKIPLGFDHCDQGVRLSPDDYVLTMLDPEDAWMRFKGSWGYPLTTFLEGPMYRNPRNRTLTMWYNPRGWMDRYQAITW